jgi:hypothetical protein
MESWFAMAETCPGCGLRFQREEGYWVGAVIINTTVTFFSFVGLFVALTVATWPAVPWGLVMGVTVGVNVILPIVFYPVSKTLWAALEMSWHPLEPGEIAEASSRMGDDQLPS